ncbi:hypothetical protein K9N68_22345 [Kovacikia minuta CCNUW1]|uniref:hypothetical protein n=1 Tax=Kovacikia minuta TaxID=2931930 RepID=UPI001CCCC524|nr:hypothetical protein [Kovacikia minuta]UBF24421.1 hypothetical protein K9N68_22345 [Kovacikia minuta CCNUW1]
MLNRLPIWQPNFKPGQNLTTMMGLQTSVRNILRELTDLRRQQPGNGEASLAYRFLVRLFAANVG